MASTASSDAVRRLLEEGIRTIAELPSVPGDSEAGAFTTFRRAVTQASSGVLVPPAQLLDDLEPKDVVLRFLFDLHGRRRMHRKQIAAVLSVLLETAWLAALQDDEALCASMPDELRPLLEHAPKPQPSGADEAAARPLPKIQGPGDKSPLRDFDETAGYSASSEAPLAPTEDAEPGVNEVAVATNLQLLEKGQYPMEVLDYSAAQSDPAIDAFEVFRKSLMRVVKTAGREGSIALDRLENKGRVLEFLVDFQAHQHKYRSRVSAVLLPLLGHDAWKEAVECDASVKAAVRELTEEPDKARRLTVVGAGMAVNLGAAAIASMSRGGVGALYVRVIAGHNLIGVGEADHDGAKTRKPDPWVRVTLNGRMQRTNTMSITRDPQFDSAPFVFHVLSADAVVRFEALDSDLVKDASLGSVSLVAAGAPKEPNFARYALEGVDHGELELEVVYMSGEDAEAQAPRRSTVKEGLESALKQLEALPGPGGEAGGRRGSWIVAPGEGAARGSWIVSQAGKPSAMPSSDPDGGPQRDDNGVLLCPAGHQVNKRKDGLHWHEGFVGAKHGSACDICDKEFSRKEGRWRCKSHCHFDVCDGCI